MESVAVSFFDLFCSKIAMQDSDEEKCSARMYIKSFFFVKLGNNAIIRKVTAFFEKKKI